MKEKIISIIVPVYNVELYLSMCIQSILNQTYKNLDIILINDGSTDHSGDILDYFKDKDKRIKVIHQSNKGLSETRNIGVNYAQGEYIIFVDSDDWIVSNAVEKLLETAISSCADMVMGNLLFCHPNGRKNIPFKLTTNDLFNNVMLGKSCFIRLSEQGKFAPMACGFMYKLEFIKMHNFRFEPFTHEDEIWTLKVMCAAERVIIIDFTFYAYRQRAGSIMYSTDYERKINDLEHISDKLEEYALTYSLVTEKELVSWIYVKIYWLYYFISKLNNEKDNYDSSILERYICKYQKIKDQLSPKAKNKCNMHYEEIKKLIVQFSRTT